MCKKLIVLLVVAGLSAPTFAGCPISATNPLRVDIDGGGVTSDCADGFMSWGPFGWNWDAPASKEWTEMGGLSGTNPVTEVDVWRENQTPHNNGAQSRNRSGGFVYVGDTGDYSPTSLGFGMNFIRLTISRLDSDTKYKIYLWSCEAGPVWPIDPCNPNSKCGCWSTTNPRDWLVNNWNGLYPGEPPDGGYGPPHQPNTGSNMPAGLADLVLACGAEGGRASLMAANGRSPLEHATNRTDFYATSDEFGVISVYGWIDPTVWTGAMHMPLNGFTIIPEPATIALLGLGGLSLIRKRRK